VSRGFNHHLGAVLIALQGYGLRTVLPFCNRLETRNLTTDPASEGLVATQGINTTFNAFMTAIAEVDYDTVFGNEDYDITDDVCLFFLPSAPHPLELNSPGSCSTLGRGNIVPSLGITRSRIQTIR
jgi:hypothetical protein